MKIPFHADGFSSIGNYDDHFSASEELENDGEGFSTDEWYDYRSSASEEGKKNEDDSTVSAGQGTLPRIHDFVLKDARRFSDHSNVEDAQPKVTHDVRAANACPRPSWIGSPRMKGSTKHRASQNLRTDG